MLSLLKYPLLTCMVAVAQMPASYCTIAYVCKTFLFVAVATVGVFQNAS